MKTPSKADLLKRLEELEATKNDRIYCPQMAGIYENMDKDDSYTHLMILDDLGMECFARDAVPCDEDGNWADGYTVGIPVYARQFGRYISDVNGEV